MSIYVMSVGELAKKRGEPIGEFVKKLNSLGFAAGSHAKKLTQPELDVIAGLLDGSIKAEPVTITEEHQTVSPVIKPKVVEQRTLVNPNVLLIKNGDRDYNIVLVETTLDSNGNVSIEVVDTNRSDNVGEALLEFRKQLGMKVGVN